MTVLKDQGLRLEEIAKWVRCLLHKHKNLSSDPQYPHKKPVPQDYREERRKGRVAQPIAK